jgi:hypothetical protein
MSTLLKIHLIYQKMKNLYNISLKIVLGATLLLSGACEPDFNGMNVDPNNPISVPTSNLMTSAQRTVVQLVYGNSNVTGISTDATRYIQHWAGTRGGGADIYTIVEQDFSDFYSGPLADLNEIIKLNSNAATTLAASEFGSNINQIAVARILKAWIFHNITDVWGDVPYKEALQGKSLALPKFDPQSEIYADLIKELDEATAQINVSEPGIKGDIIYNGDMSYWKLFAQSLKMRLGMRMSKVNAEAAMKAVAEANAAGVFTDNKQNALYKYLSATSNSNPWHYYYTFLSPTIGVTNTLIDRLKATNDPRLSIYADEADLGGGYIGTGYGLDIATANLDRDDASSWPSTTHILQPTTPFKLMTLAEVLFLQAEAAARGWISGDPKAYYDAGVTAAMQYWEIDNTQIATYLAQPAVAYQESNPFKSIGEQKWMAFYQQGIEAWSEWRRLGYPELNNAPEAFAGRSIPRRRGYPLTEITLNTANYREAVNRQGPDELSTRVWWDVP